jgi:hypothetical protein
MNKIFVESYIAKVYIHVVFCRRRQKLRRRRDLRSLPPYTIRPAAAYEMTRRCRDLRSPPPPMTRPAAAAKPLPPPPQNTCRRRLKPAAAAVTLPPPP